MEEQHAHKKNIDLFAGNNFDNIEYEITQIKEIISQIKTEIFDIKEAFNQTNNKIQHIKEIISDSEINN
ncbi:MAG: hypothetical protein PHS54_00425 [Clostridia bacterium]|nr:hypothetical protein [Clostridia bacterium]